MLGIRPDIWRGRYWVSLKNKRREFGFGTACLWQNSEAGREVADDGGRGDVWEGLTEVLVAWSSYDNRLVCAVQNDRGEDECLADHRTSERYRYVECLRYAVRCYLDDSGSRGA